MAKVSGPLMSMSASGGFAGTLVFAGWKGRPYVRQLVVPSNPHSQPQEDSRNAARVLAAAQSFFNRTSLTRSGETKTDKELLTAAAPSGQAWNGFLVGRGIGKGAVAYMAGRDAYAALNGGAKTAWATAAAAVAPAFSPVKQTEAGGGSIAQVSAAEAFFLAEYALFKAGVSDEPTGTPPVYA